MFSEKHKRSCTNTGAGFWALEISWPDHSRFKARYRSQRNYFGSNMGLVCVSTQVNRMAVNSIHYGQVPSPYSVLVSFDQKKWIIWVYTVKIAIVKSVPRRRHSEWGNSLA